MWNRLHFAQTSVLELQFLNQCCIAKKMKGNTICSSFERVLLSLSLNNGERRTCTNVKTVLAAVATLHENNRAICNFASVSSVTLDLPE